MTTEPITTAAPADAPPARAVALVAVDGLSIGRRHLLGARCLIGRLPECDLQLSDELVSKRHALIAASADSFAVEDLRSRNGTLVNGRRIERPTPLQANDLIGIGGAAFIFDPQFELLPDDSGNKAVLLVDDEQTPRTLQARAVDARSPVADGGELTRALAQTLGHAAGEALLVECTARLRSAIPCDAAALLWSADGALRTLYLATRSRSVSIPRSVVERALAAQQGLCISDAIADTQLRKGRSVVSQHVRSVLAVPLLLAGHAAGVIYLHRNEPAAYGPEQLAQLVEVAPLLVAAVVQTRHAAALAATVDRLQQLRPAADPLIGSSAPMQQLKKLIARAARSSASVLIQGETGSGKELVARQLHSQSDRASGALVAVNCAAIPEPLAESELFGHERGAFTGAEQRCLGKLELAAGGTLFLDEVGELPLGLQVKLLRALQERQFYRLGGAAPVHADFRLIAASNRDLRALIAAGRFREDLFYRLNVIAIDVPPLRERRADIPILVEALVSQCQRALGRSNCRVTADAMVALQAGRWPGNVRELRNVVERALAIGDGDELALADLPIDVISPTLDPTAASATLPQAVAALERELIVKALRRARGKKVQAAQALGISRPTLDKKIADHRIDLFGSES